jgi:hypothetical protein
LSHTGGDFSSPLSFDDGDDDDEEEDDMLICGLAFILLILVEIESRSDHHDPYNHTTTRVVRMRWL